MGTISDKLMRIISTKEDIRQALISKGYDVPTSVPFREYAKMILDLPCEGDSFPYIEGIVARYSASGLTNDQMATNPVWVDKTGNGCDLQMKGFAWGGMSGVGGYKLNWSDSTTWVNYIVQGANGTGKITNNTIHITSVKNHDALFETKTSLKSVEYKVLIKGLTDDIYLRYGVFNDGQELWTEIKNDGIYTLPSYDYDSRYNMKWKVISQTYPIDCNITIEQLPLYPGALVFDGVDDYGVCDNFPILNKEKGYTVVALRQWITRGEITQGLVSNVKNWLKDGAFLLEYRNIQANHLNKPISFGAIGSENDLPHILTYQTSKSYNGVSITTGNFEGTDVLHVGKLAPTNVGTCINAAIWELVFLDHDATEEELTKIKDYFIKTYPWLFPDQGWTAVGKSNQEDSFKRDNINNIVYLKQNLDLENFSFQVDSGYGLHGADYSRWVREINQATATHTVSKINITSVMIAGEFTYYNLGYLKQKIKVTGLPEGVNLIVNNYEIELYTITKDGIYDIDVVVEDEYNKRIGYTVDKVLESCDITIEDIVQYEGYVSMSGNEDYLRSNEKIDVSNNFTIVGEWEFLPTKKNDEAGIVISDNLTIYNTDEGLSIYINQDHTETKLDVKKLNAVCSDGRVYDKNWNEIKVFVPEQSAASTSWLYIGYDSLGPSINDRRYTKMVLKNLAIYNNKLLSKEDCIKAYNYLQTLK